VLKTLSEPSRLAEVNIPAPTLPGIAEKPSRGRYERMGDIQMAAMGDFYPLPYCLFKRNNLMIVWAAHLEIGRGRNGKKINLAFEGLPTQ